MKTITEAVNSEKNEVMKPDFVDSIFYKISDKFHKIEKCKNAVFSKSTRENIISKRKDFTDLSTCSKMIQADVESVGYTEECCCASKHHISSDREFPRKKLANDKCIATKVCSTYNVTFNVPAFFKLALFVLLMDKLTVSATPLLQRLSYEGEWPEQYSQLTEQVLPSDGQLQWLAEDGNTKQAVTDFIQRLTDQTIRNRRSAGQCDFTVKKQLLGLTEHALDNANGYRSPRKRHAPIRVTSKSWGSFCQFVHDRLKQTYCQVRYHPLLFGDTTDDVLFSVESMLLLLQQEMNVVSANDPTFSYGHFHREMACPSVIQNDREAVRTVVNDLYEVGILLKKTCLAR